MNIQPKPHYIQSMQRSSTDPITLIEEMVDNSFDAGAMEVNVHIEKDSITIEDDGVGCPDLSVMLTLGDHADHGTTRSGTNGIGFKDAAIGFGDQLRIRSTVGSGKTFSTSVVEVDWRSVMRSDSWEVHDPRVTQSETADTGTVVTISQLRKSRQRTFRKEKIARLVKELLREHSGKPSCG